MFHSFSERGHCGPPDGKQFLEDLVAAAFNDARDRADLLSNEQTQAMQSSMDLPSGFNLPGLR
jgi:DNA-binding protein YbaB